MKLGKFLRFGLIGRKVSIGSQFMITNMERNGGQKSFIVRFS